MAELGRMVGGNVGRGPGFLGNLETGMDEAEGGHRLNGALPRARRHRRAGRGFCEFRHRPEGGVRAVAEILG